MKNTSFAVTEGWPHDLSITNYIVDVVEDGELLAQTIQAIWSTNRGEWSLNKEEGIDIYLILGKRPDRDAIRAEMEEALEKIRPTASIVEFVMETDRKSRHAMLTVRIQDGEQEYTVPLEYD